MIRKAGLFLSLLVFAALPGWAQTRIVTGRVTDSVTSAVVNSGQISVAGTTIGTTIKDDGTFTLAVPVRDVTLSIRSIGFKRREIPVPASQSAVTVTLDRDYFQLEAIVVTGQATGVERRNLANAVATLNAQQLAQVSTSSVSQALQGKLASANIIKGSGAPGSNDIVSLRGVSSINGAFTPLYVIDGVIASDVMIPRGTNFVTQASRGTTIATTGENATNRIADINPNDIENVEVLKGAAASAIYGSKASNGVIIITTKRGRVGTPQFTLTQRVGTARVSKKNGYRRFPSMAEAVARYGIVAQDPVTGWAADKYFDNESALVGAMPLNYETFLSMSGGTETTKYYASGMARHEGGIIFPTFADKRSLNLNVDQSIGSRLSVQLGTDVINTSGDKGLTINENNNSSYYAGLSNTPTFFDLRAVCPDASRQVHCAGGVYPINPYVAANPLATAAGLKNYENVWRFLGTGRINLDAIRTAQHTLRIGVNGGADFFQQDNRVFSPPDLQFEPLDGLLGTSIVSEGRNLNYNLNANVVHTFKTNGGTSATTQFGVQYETRELFVDRVRASNLVGGLQVTTAGTDVGIDAQHTYTKDFGVFGQEEFLTLKEKLLVTLGLRADQSSNNGDPNKVFYYPKASASYRFPQLKRGLIDELKLRVALGESGNQPLYGQKFTALAGLNVGGVPAAQIATASSAVNIVPERQLEIEGGMDATLFGGRANFEGTVYQKRITDLLLSRSLPRSYGFTSEFLNGGILTTKGIELALNAFILQSRSVQWNPRLSFHTFRSTIDSLPVPKFGGCGFGGGSPRIEQGGSATAIYGTDSTVTVDPVTGAPVAKGACIKIGENRPDYTLQLSNDFTFKALHFSVVLDRQKGGMVTNLTWWSDDQNRNSVDWDTPAPDGRPLGLVRPLEFASGTRYSKRYVQDASYLKVREATLSVDIPQSLVRKLWSGSRYARVSVSGRNLLTFTKYRGVDQESRWVAEQNTSQRLGQELWAYPPSRTFWFSVDVGF